MVDAKQAILSLQALAPDLSVVRAIRLAKGACAPPVQQHDASDEDLTGLLDNRQTDRELAEKIAKNIKSDNLIEASVVSFDIAGHKKSFSVLVAHANADGSIRTFLHNQPHGGFTYCMACNLFLWPLRPPPALVPPSAELKSKLWNAADTALRCMAAERTGLARRGGGGVGGRGTGRFRSSSSSSGSTSGKRGSPEGETSCAQFLPPLQPLPAACINGPEPSADVAEHEFFTGLGGWMPVASGSSQLANIRTTSRARVTTVGCRHCASLFAAVRATMPGCPSSSPASDFAISSSPSQSSFVSWAMTRLRPCWQQWPRYRAPPIMSFISGRGRSERMQRAGCCRATCGHGGSWILR
ncbi:hypothetical protein Vretimale_11760 [Volvox reticuliferus]|uniref:Uncharacterized protein n=1 Tax=Volvox reticuliferus TaxID=1737510 RepID=A0A8J4GH84_9CHLO|nr:hypothetical protein Vretimale_11760 [Volvox reticuliferus]